MAKQTDPLLAKTMDDKKRIADQDQGLQRSHDVPDNQLGEENGAAVKNYDDDDMKRRRLAGDGVGIGSSFASTSDGDNHRHGSLTLLNTEQNTTVVNVATMPLKGINDPSFSLIEETDSSQSSSHPSQQESQDATNNNALRTTNGQQQQMIFIYDANGQLIAVPNPFAMASSQTASGFSLPNIFPGATTTLSPAAEVAQQQAAAFAAVQQQFWAQAAAFSAACNAAPPATSSSQQTPLSTNTSLSSSSPQQLASANTQPPLQTTTMINNHLTQMSAPTMQSLQAAFSGQQPNQGSAQLLASQPMNNMTGQQQLGQFINAPPQHQALSSMNALTVSQHHPPGVTGRPPVILYLTCDDDSLSDYQCLVRKQIELFEALEDDVESNAQGRNKPIVIGQVGIRCRHCAALPPRHRARGATYYPAKLDGLYQAAQNMASSHLCSHCQLISPPIRQELLVLRDRKSSAGGGKKYWADGVRVLGVYEDADVLRFERR